ncbi:MAG TPA: hypothetical protein VJM50_05935 [Pyrinomonadaceae bacterium]|nr:hypothetical protein [Pyrinomonadaceae bacterium]
MSVARRKIISDVIEEAAQPLTGERDDYDSLLQPLERHALWESGEPPETFPTGV